MATNRTFADGPKTRKLDVSGVNGSGTGNLVLSGDPGCVGKIPFVALTDEDADGYATCQLDGTFRLAVKADDAASPSAVAVGDILYWDTAEGEVNKDATNGVRFGYAEAAVASGQTGTIDVLIGY